MFQFGTKAETLHSIGERLSKAQVAPSLIFTVQGWRSNTFGLVQKIQSAFNGQPLIIRSSGRTEDTAQETAAGIHESVANIRSDQVENLVAAVNRVIASYRKTGNPISGGDQVLIQPMVTDIGMSGVVFTHDLNTGAPYYVINYDDTSGRHDTITAGYGDVSRTLIIRRGFTGALRSPRFIALMEAVGEIERIVQTPGLDIEFAVSKTGVVYVLQVRRLATRHRWNDDVEVKVNETLMRVRGFLQKRLAPIPSVWGRKSIFGIMPDWNPVEMIGAVPRQLASSLYRCLITDSIWAEARAEMGYRNLSGRPLMFDLGGRWYIDVRESFNSYLPAGLPRRIGEKLVDHWLNVLEAHPERHDKIEFEVATTIHTPDFGQNTVPTLQGIGFSKPDIETYAAALRRLTNRIIRIKPDLLAAQMKRIEQLTHRRNRALARTTGAGGDDPRDCIRALLWDCRNFGTKPFSILARCAFVSEAFIRSFVHIGIFGPETADAFRGSIRTVLSEFLEDVAHYQRGELEREPFMHKDGHLRPGTYDILSRRYDQQFDFRCKHRLETSRPRWSTPKPFSLRKPVRRALDALLARAGYGFDADRLVAFMAMSIQGREYAKFMFTRNVSEILERIAAWGKTIGMDRESLSHLTIEDIVADTGRMPKAALARRLKSLAVKNRQTFETGKALRLPFLITRPEDIDVVPLLKCRPNFITSESVRAPGLFLTGGEPCGIDLEGSIVLIESADPGFDWIFFHPIRGLVTQYGGANSHMAIRCAEIGLPAAIGCGEQLFGRCREASQIHLDCGAEIIEAVD